MNLTSGGLVRLLQLLDRVESEVYPETPMAIHTEVTEMAVRHCSELFTIGPGMSILDVGCGQGPALVHFRTLGAEPVGITLSDRDVEVCQAQGFEVRKMDQSFLEFEEGCFDLVWARHVIEHSIMPLFTLREFCRVLRPGGWLYLEVPDTDTDAAHAWNANHYSIFSRSGWLALLSKGGFECIDGREYNFPLLNGGTDRYLGFYCKKKDA